MNKIPVPVRFVLSWMAFWLLVWAVVTVMVRR